MCVTAVSSPKHDQLRVTDAVIAILSNLIWNLRPTPGSAAVAEI